jgi:1-acyl-sn-glycerol-3-phosphate acyltransferase
VESREKLDQARAERRVLETLAGLLEELGAERALAGLGADSLLDRELGLGSLERVELMVRLESELGLTLPENVLAEARTPKDIARALAGRKASPPLEKHRVRPVGAATRLSPPSRAATLVDVLRLRAKHEPQRAHIYLREPGRDEADSSELVIRYGELYRDATALAGGLSAVGIAPRETIAIMLPTSREFFTAFVGALLAGAIPVPLYPPFNFDRIEDYAARQANILTNAAVRIFVTVRSGLSVARVLRPRVPSLRQVTTVERLLSRAAPAPAIELEPDSPALIQYTSGSTGAPKGVLLAHRNLLANIRAIGRALKVEPTDVAVSWLPLYHDMGLIGCWLAPLYFGVPVTIMSPLAFLSRPERWLWAIHARRATVSAAPNFGYELCARKIPDKSLEGLDLGSWRAALNGAEQVSADTIERFTRRFRPHGFRPEAMLPVYGLAESSLAIAIPPLGRGPRVMSISRDLLETEGRAMTAGTEEKMPLRFVSCGRPLPGHEVRVTDAEGKTLPQTREGNLEFRGPSTMLGYYRNPQATRAVTRAENWVASGDRGYLADGEVFVTGRSKDVIIRAGRNLYPQEIEELASDVSGVRRGCVAAFGISDPDLGTEKLVVVAETREETEEERQRIAHQIQTRLADVFEAPADDVVLVPPRALPKTSSGKLRRSDCRALYQKEELGRVKKPRAMLLKIAGAEAAVALGRTLAVAGRWAYGLYALATAALGVLPLWLMALIVPSRRAMTAAARLAVRVWLVATGCRLRVRGIEHLVKTAGPLVFVANHASYLDPLLVIAALPRDCAFVVKREAMGWPVLGAIIRRLEHVPVERFDPKESAASAESLRQVLERQRSLFFFPEGTFSLTAGLLPFRLGAFKLAAETGRPIVPVALVGTRRWLSNGVLLRRTDLELVVEAPLVAPTTALSDLVRLREESAERIARLVGEPRLDQVTAGPLAAEK